MKAAGLGTRVGGWNWMLLFAKLAAVIKSGKPNWCSRTQWRTLAATDRTERAGTSAIAPRMTGSLEEV